MKKVYIFLFLSILFKSSTAQVINVGGTGVPGVRQISPYDIDYSDPNKIQYIYRASELMAAGATAGRIDSIAFYRAGPNSTTLVGSASGDIYSTYTSSLNNSSSGGFESTSGRYASYSASYSTLKAGWNTHRLNPPLVWNGTSNLLFSICTGPPSNRPGGGSDVNVMSTSYGSTLIGSGFQTFCFNITATSAFLGKPVIKFYYSSAPSLSITTSSTPVSCSGLNDGSARVIASGGYPPFSYLWSNSGSTNQINGLVSGSYRVTVTDGLGAILNGLVIVNSPPSFTASFSRVQQISCFGANDGELDLNIVNGIAPYNYSWSNNATGTSQTNLSKGIYTAHAIDANGCSSTLAQITLFDPNPIRANLNRVYESCTDSYDGSITSAATGGTGAYTYSWSNQANTPNISNLTAGKYTLTITDANGCSTIDSLVLINPGKIDTTVFLVGNRLIANESNASYQWLNCKSSYSPIPNANLQWYFPTPNGKYAVEITRGNCIDTSECISYLTVGLKENREDYYSIDFNISQKILYIKSAQPIDEQVLRVYSANGQLVYQNKISGTQSKFILNELGSGIYIVNMIGKSKKILIP